MSILVYVYCLKVLALENSIGTPLLVLPCLGSYVQVRGLILVEKIVQLVVRRLHCVHLLLLVVLDSCVVVSV